MSSAFAREQVLALATGGLAGGALAASHTGLADPEWPDSTWRLVGAPDLDLSWSGPYTLGFEAPDVASSGWDVDGDGRIVPNLGATLPVEGERMAQVSTGLGYTVNAGSFRQTFCLPAGVTGVRLAWRFFSGEFKEFYGSSYQDRLVVTLTGATGEGPRVEVLVDDLCGATDGSCQPCPDVSACDAQCMASDGCWAEPDTGVCEGTYECGCGRYGAGLWPSDVSFDQGGVYDTHWRELVLPVGDLGADGPVTLSFLASDNGDSIYDTVILIDDIALCSPDCAGKACGDDGCGGSCWSCPSVDHACVDGTCCLPGCAGKACGDDGCGGSCGDCATGKTCTPEGSCAPAG